jgi:hypothetical protein
MSIFQTELRINVIACWEVKKRSSLIQCGGVLVHFDMYGIEKIGVNLQYEEVGLACCAFDFVLPRMTSVHQLTPHYARPKLILKVIQQTFRYILTATSTIVDKIMRSVSLSL